MKWNRLAIIIPLLYICSGLSLFSQTTHEERRQHVFLILDVSGSMNEESKFNRVKDYLEKDVFGNLLHDGDLFSLILFGNTARTTLSKEINSEADRRTLLDSILQLKADDDFTDIGVVMETLFSVLSENRNSNTEDLILLITDGKNAPPSNSPYFGTDISLDERFRDIGRKISQNGWFLYVIGIGASTDAQTIAGAVEGSLYRETDETMKGVGVEEYLGHISDVQEERKAAESEVKKSEELVSGTDRKNQNLSFATREAGIQALIRGVAGTTGIPSLVLVFMGIFAIAAIAFLFFLLFLVRPFGSMEIRITDNLLGKNRSKEYTMNVGSIVHLDTEIDAESPIGREDCDILCIERRWHGFNLRVTDGSAIAAQSPYHKKGLHRFKGGEIELANGGLIQILIRN